MVGCVFVLFVYFLLFTQKNRLIPVAASGRCRKTWQEISPEAVPLLALMTAVLGFECLDISSPH